ncbi:MAG: hypothetical protein AAF441_23175 [Pseudomonadota bacterium]
MADPGPNETAQEPLRRYMRWHMGAYAGAIALGVITHYIWPADRGLYIPILLWGCGLLAHYLYVRTVTTGDEWVDERSENISLNATDLSHIESIRERHEAREAERAKPPSTE